MNKKALILSHLGLGGISNIVKALRNASFDIYVVSSSPYLEREIITNAWSALDLDFTIVETKVLNLEHIFGVFGQDKLKGFDLCLSVWEGQRALMAEVNSFIGASDVDPTHILRAQDKYAMRKVLYEAKLSRIPSFLIADAALAQQQFPHSKFVIKPLRSAGGLQTRVVDTLEDVIASKSDSLIAEDDELFAEYYANNRLYIEPFIEGEEFSFEVIMHDYVLVFGCEHEKVGMVFEENTILETGLASPATSIDEARVAQGLNLCKKILTKLELGFGCYHVEFKCHKGEWELIEVNPRVGGSLIYDSVKLQYDYCLLQRWAESLCGHPPAAAQDRLVGAYFQIGYAQANQTIQNIQVDKNFPEPVLCQKLLAIGDRADAGSREIFAAQSLWKTHLASHSTEVARLNKACYLRYS